MEERRSMWHFVTRVAAIAALYAAATIAWSLMGGSLSWGPIQLRLSEALCMLAIFTIDAVPGLAIGCAIANIINTGIAGLGTFSAFDYVYCTMVIVLSLLFTWKMRQRPALCALAPLAANVAMAFVIKANFGTASVFDVVFGSLATAVGARFTWKFRDRPVVAAAGPVISNALIISAYLPLMPQSADFYVIPFMHISPVGSYALMFLFGVVSIGLGEAIVMYALGLPLAHALRRTRLVRFLTQPHD